MRAIVHTSLEKRRSPDFGSRHPAGSMVPTAGATAGGAAVAAELWTVVFLHGLESGPAGSKARYIRRHFPAACVPDLGMSAWDPRKKNSATRNLANLQASLDGCTRDAMTAIREAQSADEGVGKLLVVGSSWGGMVALRCIEREGLRPDATLLLAPALAAKGFYGWFWPRADISEGHLDCLPPKSVLVVHGTADDTVPIDASRELAAIFPSAVDLLEVDGGDHRLNNALNIRRDGADESVEGEALSLRGLMHNMMAEDWRGMTKAGAGEGQERHRAI